jgi:hypothetical protein
MSAGLEAAGRKKTGGTWWGAAGDLFLEAGVIRS